MATRAALLDASGVFLRMDETDNITPLHLTQITECDLPPGKYRWIPDARNPYGGAFWSLEWLRLAAGEGK